MAKSTIVVDLGYGDAGKGSVVDSLTRRAPSTLVVRFNGGPQAAHNVITPEGKHHTFASFGSGSFAGARTFCTEQVLVNPLSILAEASHLEALGQTDIMDRLVIHESCSVITPYHKVVNRIRETVRGDGRHGSTGHGVGETMMTAIAGFDLQALDMINTPSQLTTVREYLYQVALELDPESPLLSYFESPSVLQDTIDAAHDVFGRRGILVDDMWFAKEQRKDQHIIFEGAQGVLLDEWHGFHPYTTWSTVTPCNALGLLDGPVEVLGILRSYGVRHGPGPFVGEDPGMLGGYDEMHNGWGEWQGNWRVGHADLVAAKYAIEVCGGDITGFGMTYVDRLEEDQLVVVAYRIPDGDDDLFEFVGNKATDIIPGDGDLVRQERLTAQVMGAKPVYSSVPGDEFPAWFADQLDLPLRMTSGGPTDLHKAWFL